MRTVYYNGLILTGNEQGDTYQQGYLLVEGGHIHSIGEGVWMPQIGENVDKKVDLQGKWVMPGWVNTHGHAAMSILRGFADDLPLQEWLNNKIWPMEAKFTEETVRCGSALAIVEMLKSGTTCFMDMYDHMPAVAEQVELSGIRAVLSRGIIGLGSEQEQKEKLMQGAEFARDWKGKADGRITTMMAPHAPYTCPPAFISRIVDQAEKIDVPVHIHMSETEEEVRQNVRQYGERPVKHLQQIGVFDRPTLVAHAVHLNDEEIVILKEHDVKISHNPASNLKLGSGIARIPDLLREGFHVSIGTDGAASNNNLDMFQEVRLAALLHKGSRQDPTVIPSETALAMGTRFGAECVFLDQIGSLEVGQAADFITLNHSGAHLTPSSHALSHIIYSASGHDVVDVYVQGRQVVQNRECLYLDEEEIRWKTERMFQTLNPL